MVELKYLILPAVHHYVQICFRLDVLVNWVGCFSVWTCEFILFLYPDHLPPASSLGRVLLPQLHLGPLPCGFRQQHSPVTPHGASHFPHTHGKRVFASAISAPTVMLVFSPQAKEGSILPVTGCTVRALGRGMDTLQASYAAELWLKAWRWHMVQHVNRDSLFCKEAPQLLSHWQWGLTHLELPHPFLKWYTHLLISLFSHLVRASDFTFLPLFSPYIVWWTLSTLFISSSAQVLRSCYISFSHSR